MAKVDGDMACVGVDGHFPRLRGDAGVPASRNWNTGDRPTDANLDSLEMLARPSLGITVERYMDMLRAVIGLERMLPERVRGHFSLPFLIIGDAAYAWSPERLHDEAAALCSSLEDGLAAAHADPAIAGGSADLSDRPATRGEEVREALDAYREHRGPRELGRLRQAALGTSLHRHLDRLDKWLQRKRPSSSDRPIEYEIACVLGDMSRRIDELHGDPASYTFSEAWRAAQAEAGRLEDASDG